MNENEQNISMCPNCNSGVDPLRAAAVSIIDGKIVHFCSSSCREKYLHRSSGSGDVEDDINDKTTSAEIEIIDETVDVKAVEKQLDTEVEDTFVEDALVNETVKNDFNRSVSTGKFISYIKKRLFFNGLNLLSVTF
ncbi:MAG: hypothetical protein JXR91_10225, partial [Deltaproteobacteria bacterium]|nr:hypothetical protein [Deltaproteobacteria bacterium]